MFQTHTRDFDDIKINLDIDFFNQLKFDVDSLKSYRIEAALSVQQSIGDKIALCFSGGVDSQCMLQCFIEAGIEVDVFILRFNKELNVQDVTHAIEFCDKSNIKLNIIDIDVLNFLSINNYDYGMKYRSASPHFNVHYKLFDILRDKGYDGVVAGGNAPLFTTHDNMWGTNYNKNAQNYINYSNISGYKCQGNFLSYHPKLTMAIGLLTPPVYGYSPHRNNLSQDERKYWEDFRYKQKVRGYQKAGFDVVQQAQKYTGFELVKKYLEQKTGDGWTFEKLYRHPLERILLRNPTGVPRYLFKDEEVERKVNSLYSNNFPAGHGSPSGI